jgi:hypothetical protein
MRTTPLAKTRARARSSSSKPLSNKKLAAVENKHTTERGHGITYELRPVLCGKPGCKRHHGPYWYAYWTAGGRVRTAYIGKKFVRLEVKDPAALSQKGVWD